MPYDPNDPETKAAIDAIVAKANEKHDADIAGLKTKTEELIAANKKLKKGQEIDPAEVDRLEAEADKLRTELKDAQKAAKEAAAAKEKAEKALADEAGFTQKLLIDNGLNAALAEAGVTDPDYLASTKAIMAASAQVATEGADRVVKIGDKLVADHIKEWAGTESAKKFISAPNNGGGGAPGGKGGASGADLSKLPPVERITAERERQAAAG
jgi:alanyl-tRNA synthetase